MKKAKKRAVKNETSEKMCSSCGCESNMCCGNSCRCSKESGTKCGGTYLLGFLGSAIYFISTASSFWMGLVGVLKSIVWPAFLVYELLKFIGV
jgi:hypothetical protein